MEKFKDKVNSDPYANFLGIKTEEVTKGYARSFVQVTGNMLNFGGTPHGGLIFSLADVAFSAAACSIHMPTTALNISGTFLKTAKVGDILVAEAKLVHSSKHFGNFVIEVKNGKELVSLFHGTAYKIGM